ncbi:MAG: hypothetical protein HWD61_02425 [Parachlamydiaceae bacterium]|nr:MAG: hypothetical protein HWD61_02425 [Parachlamydiaceae bacterium]
MPAFMTIDESEISQNTARFGGGIANTGGFLEVTNSKITANLAEEAGGGIFSFLEIMRLETQKLVITLLSCKVVA